MSEIPGDLQTIQTVDRSPFKKLVLTIGELPSSFVESMSYYELLAWFTHYLENTIIPTVNNNAACVEELQQKFIELDESVDERLAEQNTTITNFVQYINSKVTELQNYINNYFDNLDVQDEINNKLDAMAQGGYFENIIQAYLATTATYNFSNLSLLLASTALANGSHAKIDGYYSANDGGSASFIIREKTPNESANGLTTYQMTASSNLVAEIIKNPVMSVKQFGVYGDGTHEDAARIRSVMDTLAGGTILFPAGTYLLERSLNVPANTIVRGVGANTIFKAKNAINVNDNLVKLEGANKSEVHNFAIDGNRSNQDANTYTQYGLMISGCENVVADGILTRYINGVGIQVYNSRYTTIRSCEGHHCRYHAFECEQCQDCSFTSVYGHDNDRHGIFISPGEVGGTGSINNTINNSAFNNNTEYGVAFGIDAQSISIGLTRNNIVSNCMIHNNGYYGVSIYKVDRVTIIGCDINGNGAFGVYLYQAKECLINGNRLQDNSASNHGGYDEICLEGNNDGTPSLHNLISNNILQPSQARYGINEASAGDGPNVIVNNYIYTNGITGKYNLQNSGTYYDKADVELDKTGTSLRMFNGIMINYPSALPTGMGMDSPFQNVLRVINTQGATQVVNTTTQPIDFYINGNSQLNISENDINLQGNNLVNYQDLSGWTAGIPSTPNSAGIAGMRAYDSNYLYICTATNTWKRIAFDTSWS